MVVSGLIEEVGWGGEVVEVLGGLMVVERGEVGSGDFGGCVGDIFVEDGKLGECTIGVALVMRI